MSATTEPTSTPTVIESGADGAVDSETDGGPDAGVDVELEDELDLGDVYPFECTRVDLFAGKVTVGDGINPTSIIEHATRYTSILIESADGGRALDVWRTTELAVIHDATSQDVAPGVVFDQGRLEFQVAALLAESVGQLAATPVGPTDGGDDSDRIVLLIGSGSPGDEGPKAAVINRPGSTAAGIAPPGTSEIDARPASAVTAWAMIVEALRSEASPPK